MPRIEEPNRPYSIPKDFGDRLCERCGAKAEWGAGPNNEHVLCLECANDWSEFCATDNVRKAIDSRHSGWTKRWALAFLAFLMKTEKQ